MDRMAPLGRLLCKGPSKTIRESIGRPRLTTASPCKNHVNSYNVYTTTTAAASGEIDTHLPPPGPPLPSVSGVTRRTAIKEAKPFSDFLTDSYNRQHDYLRISVTERCNLRCMYCMPEEGIELSPKSHILTTPEIVYLSSLFVSQGVTKIRLTGGEPTVRKDLVPMMKSIGQLRTKGLKELAITTNGISLHRKLDAMAEAGLTGVNMSLDTLDPFQFEIMTRRKGFDQVMKSVDRILEMKKLGAPIKLKINCVVMRGLNHNEILPFVEMTREKDIEVRFIEYMPFGGNKWSEGKMMPFAELLDLIRVRYPAVHRTIGHKNDTAKTYEIPGFVGRIGFITSMTNDFCGTCNRLRVTSDGNLKVCLHGNTEVSLRDLLREGNENQPIDEVAFERLKQQELARSMDGFSVDDRTTLGWGPREQNLLALIGSAVKRKKEKHAGIGELEHMENRPMILIDPSEQCLHTSDHLSGDAHPTTTHMYSSSVPTYLLSASPQYKRSGARMFSTSPRQASSCSPLTHRSGPGQPKVPGLFNCFITNQQSVRSFSANHIALESEQEQLNYMTAEDRYVMADANPFKEGQSDSIVTVREISQEIRLVRPDQPPDSSVSSPVSQAIVESTITKKQPGSKTRDQEFTHLNKAGEVHMVDVGAKPHTIRKATAIGSIEFSNPTVLEQIKANGFKKGDVLSVARIAGIMAAKKCPDIIPLAHPIFLSGVNVQVNVLESGVTTSEFGHGSGLFGSVEVIAEAKTTGPTGVEMEALTAVAGACLTIYDMVKGVDKGAIIRDIRLWNKEGGRSGSFSAKRSDGGPS